MEHKPDVKWKKLTGDYVHTLTGADGREVLQVDPEALRLLSY